jgi:hypothetical protein
LLPEDSGEEGEGRKKWEGRGEREGRKEKYRGINQIIGPDHDIAPRGQSKLSDHRGSSKFSVVGLRPFSLVGSLLKGLKGFLLLGNDDGLFFLGGWF